MPKKKLPLLSMRIRAIAAIFVIAIGGIALYSLYQPNDGRPSTLPTGGIPAIGLPMYDFSHNTMIYGFGNFTLADNITRTHNGFDFSVNATTGIVAPYYAYVERMETIYNDIGKLWQTNLLLRINPQWSLGVAFESFAQNETYAMLQLDAVWVREGQYVVPNQTLGYLLVLGNGPQATLHLGVKSGAIDLCPYDYFTSSAKATFANQFYKVNVSNSWCN